jgi:hypothetical protein
LPLLPARRLNLVRHFVPVGSAVDVFILKAHSRRKKGEWIFIPPFVQTIAH